MGRRPRHLTRRTAVYKDGQKATERCLAATRWFTETMAKFETLEALTRAEQRQTGSLLHLTPQSDRLSIIVRARLA